MLTMDSAADRNALNDNKIYISSNDNVQAISSVSPRKEIKNENNKKLE